MLRELIEAGARFEHEGKTAPVGYKRKAIQWIVDFMETPDPAFIPVDESTRLFAAPDRERSGRIAAANLKPYLLIDNALYVFGLKRGNETPEQRRMAHESYVSLLEEAGRYTGKLEFEKIVQYLKRRDRPALPKGLKPEHLVLFRFSDDNELSVDPDVRKFWKKSLVREYSTEEMASCSVCMEMKPILRTLPQKISILGQPCQVTSFNKTAFESFGKQQTANAPLCFDCVASALQGLQYLIADRRHQAVLCRVATKGDREDPLRNELAVFWLREPTVDTDEGAIDLEAALQSLLLDSPESAEGPAPELAHVDHLLRIPWRPSQAALNLRENKFYLAVFSANKARLVVREWITVAVEELRLALRRYLDAVKLIDPFGNGMEWTSVARLTTTIRNANPNIVRGLLRTAYQGFPPPNEVLQAAILRLRVPSTWDVVAAREGEGRQSRDARRGLLALVAGIKLVLTFRDKEFKQLEQLQPNRANAPYCCGRLLALQEEAQRRSSVTKLNTTLVDRFYGSASTAPQAVFPILLRQTQTAHLSKVRREKRGAVELERELEEILGGIEQDGGFPNVMTLDQQAWFALGFYHQRAEYRSRMATRMNLKHEETAIGEIK